MHKIDASNLTFIIRTKKISQLRARKIFDARFFFWRESNIKHITKRNMTNDAMQTDSYVTPRKFGISSMKLHVFLLSVVGKCSTNFHKLYYLKWANKLINFFIEKPRFMTRVAVMMKQLTICVTSHFARAHVTHFEWVEYTENGTCEGRTEISFGFSLVWFPSVVTKFENFRSSFYLSERTVNPLISLSISRHRCLVHIPQILDSTFSLFFGKPQN